MNVKQRPGTVYAQVILLVLLSAVLVYASLNGLNQPPWIPLALGVVHAVLIPLLLWGRRAGFWITLIVLLINPVVSLLRLNLIHVLLSLMWMYPLVNPDTLDYYGVRLTWLRALWNKLTPPSRRYLREKEAEADRIK